MSATDTQKFLEGRFISPYARYSVQVVEPIEEVLSDTRGMGYTNIRRKPVIAEFETGGLFDHEIEAAFEKFNFSGLPEGVNPLTRISVYDPEAQAVANDWPDDLRREVEGRLFRRSEQAPGDLIFVPAVRVATPWPSYDADSVEEIIAAQERFGYDAELVRRYEQENLNREEIVNAMLAKEPGSGDLAPEETITVSA